jgi:hypothetical protein
MNRFRGLLIDPGAANQERPVQVFGNNRADIEEWARRVLGVAVSEKAVVVVYETVENEIARLQR